MTTPKRHHFLPEFYQQEFTSNGFLWLFDRATSKFRREQPINTAVIGHYYSVEAEDGTKDPRVERFLADVIESEAKPIITKLDKGDAITSEERDELAYFVSFLHFRVPRFQRFLDEMLDGAIKALTPLMIQSPEDLRRDLTEVPDLTDEQRGMPPGLLYQLLIGGKYAISATSDLRLHMMLSLGTKFQSYFSQMDWAVMHAPKGTAFLTTDAPLVIVPPIDYPVSARSAPGFLTPGATKILPLTCRTLLAIGDQGEKVVHVEISKDMVRRTNILVVEECERFVIGRDEAHVRSLVSKTQVDRRSTERLVHVG